MATQAQTPLDPPAYALDESFAVSVAAVLRGGDVLTLNGDLGAGKTTFAQAMGRYWQVDEGAIRSPTFGLVHVLELDDFDLVHADLYRMNVSAEVVSCGLAELLGAPDCVCVIEWPSLAQPYLPAGTLGLALHHDPQADTRTATPNATLAARLGGR